MSRHCVVTGKGVLSGNNVSHAKNRTRRRFLPNLQVVSLISEALGRMVRLRITTSAVRTIEFKGGLDNYLTKAKSSTLEPEILALKKTIMKRIKAKQA